MQINTLFETVRVYLGFIDMNIVTIVGIAVARHSVFCGAQTKNPSTRAGSFLGRRRAHTGMIISEARPLFDRMHSLLDASGTKAAYVQILFKSLGLCFITQIACDACRDLGETAIATKVEAAGKIAVLLVSLPLFEEILKIAGQLIG
jgi:stage III sporulation protein AD